VPQVWLRGLLLLVVPAVALAGGEDRILVLLTNDVHGQLDPLPPSPVRPFLRDQEAGGYAHLATMVRAARREAAEGNASFLLVDAGDIYQGTPVGNETKGEAVIEAMNALQFDAMALGNHEFDFGVGNLVRLIRRAKFPVLAANTSGLRDVRPYVLLAPPRVPCRIAVIGLVTPETPGITAPGCTKGVRFSDPAAATRAILKEVEADLYFVVSHLGRDDDLKLAAEVPGLALILGGHSHTPTVERVGRTLVLQTHARGLSLGRADLVVERDGWTVKDAKGRLLPVDPKSTPPDPAVRAVIDTYGRELDARLKEVVGELAAPARRGDGMEPSTAGNWMADVIRRVGEAEVGLTNLGGIRCDLEKGPVTRADCYRLMPFENDVVAMDLHGADLRRLLVRHFKGDGPYRLVWSGLLAEVTADRKLVAVEVAGEPLDDARTYRVATNSFLAAGGDGFGDFRRGRNVTRTGVLIRDALARDLLDHSPVTPAADERLRVAATDPR
jgi:2',3'-cyclic-nucleotide 2'-phosphodiesterase (5'-nucleotidase family)